MTLVCRLEVNALRGVGGRRITPSGSWKRNRMPIVGSERPWPQIVRPDVPQREARLMRGRLSISWMINPADGIPLVMILARRGEGLNARIEAGHGKLARPCGCDWRLR